MHAEIAISGSGGQGVLLIGRLLAEAGCLEGQEVVWLPTYGAEKRGGTVTCHVTISDAKIGALTISHPNVGIAMNQPSLTRLESIMKQGGLLMINESAVTSKATREDLKTVYIPANQMALKTGSDSVANLIILGVLVASYPMVEAKSVMAAMKTYFSSNQKALEINQLAFNSGFDLI